MAQIIKIIYDSIPESDRCRITRFEDSKSLAIPKYTRYAFVTRSDGGAIGVITSRKGNREYVREKSEAVFKSYNGSIARLYARTRECIEAKV